MTIKILKAGENMNPNDTGYISMSNIKAVWNEGPIGIIKRIYRNSPVFHLLAVLSAPVE